ncbi:putative coiled-coil domain-containing protein 195 [Amblyraja radiata]|uniref:putative coiled-coil domain-containing protein 195 n=1 Tax=Amblyraja radiata TaxID=386614 RepID=UPI001403178C|nr:putative coiled-coil domain-containing protein 195 [Amblyraja radiata]
MDSNKRLKQMVKEMRSDMKKLESENKALRVKLSQNGKRAETLDEATISALHQQLRSEEALTHANLRRNISAPALEGEARGTTMTVRRYSISSLHAFTVGNKRHKSPDQNRTHQRSRQEGSESTTVIHPYTTMKVTTGQGVPDELLETKSPEGKQPQDTPLQEYVPKCKYKMKSVTFLLPVDVVPHSEDEDSSWYTGYQNCAQLPPIQEIDY